MKPVTSSDETNRLPSLDGLRAVAIILVLMWHLMPGRESDRGLYSAIFKIADIGWSGVDLFFVLSGFLITGILLKARLRKQPVRLFLTRRLLRIMPVYYASLAVVFVLLPALVGNYVSPVVSAQAPFWLYLANYFPSEPLAGSEFLFGHFWSLAVEMQFYLVWPFVIYLCSPRQIWLICIVALFVAVSGRAVAVFLGAEWPITSFWLPFRLDGLVTGSMVALALHRGISYERVRPLLLSVIALGMSLLAGVVWFGVAKSVFKGLDHPPLYLALRIFLPAILATVFAALLWASLEQNVFSRCLSSSVFAPIARYSYGMYIFHFLLIPVFENTFGTHRLMDWTGGLQSAIYLYFALSSAISFLLAALSYHLFEVRFMRLRPRVNSTGRSADVSPEGA